MSVNKVILVGRLGADPVVTQLQGDNKVVNFNMATNKVWVDKEGVKQERTTWHRVTAWGAVGEVCARYLIKGKQVYLEGSIEHKEYVKDGVKRVVTEILANSIQLLSNAPTGQDVMPREEQTAIPF